MNPLKLSRLLRLIFAIVFQYIASRTWLDLNNQQFLHYFPDETPLGLLMWSYVIDIESISHSEHLILHSVDLPGCSLPADSSQAFGKGFAHSSFPRRFRNTRTQSAPPLSLSPTTFSFSSTTRSISRSTTDPTPSLTFSSAILPTNSLPVSSSIYNFPPI